MAPDSSAKAGRTGLSLYANLLDPSSKKDSAPGTISGAPVLYKQGAAGGDPKAASTDKQQINAAALRFQPTKRPQLPVQKPKSKPTIQRAPQHSSPVNIPAAPPLETSATAPRLPPTKTTLADWTADGDDNDANGSYAGEKRQRGGRKKKRKTNKEQAVLTQNWDDIYDPSRPNNYEDYKNSDEKLAEIREWKDRLYAHRMARRHSSELGSDSEDGYRPQMSNQFAPPSGLNFAPPPTFNNSPPPPPPDDATGEDAYTRRIRLSQMNVGATDSPPPPPPAPEPAIPAQTPTTTAPPPTIARAPVRYNLPAAPSEIPSSEAELATALANEPTSPPAAKAEEDNDDTPRSLRPGQQGFAERLLSKYGWSKGSGLGASGSGIINPLRVQLEKQKKKPDSEGGGFVGPRTGTIVGGQKSKKTGADSGAGKFGVMSEVVVLRGMVDGMDLDEEMAGGGGGEGGGGGLMQEIGEECGEKYGRVERVFIDRGGEGGTAPVFVKFTSQLSALRAVNALEGRIFNGNAITARFFDAEKFERGEYT